MTHGYLPLDMRFFARDTRCIFMWLCSESLKTAVYLLLSCTEFLETHIVFALVTQRTTLYTRCIALGTQRMAHDTRCICSPHAVKCS